MPATGVVWDRLLQDLQTACINLNLQGTVAPSIGANVILQQLPEQLNISQFPCILVTHFGEQEEESGDSDFEEDCVVYPVRLMVLDDASPYFQARRPDYLSWRHSIQSTLRGRVIYPLLASTPECFDIRVQNLPAVDPRLPESQWFRSGVIALCHTQEQRNRNQT